ncbi:hypothetical protein PR202_ga13231 [Eleusine coracana subsp. coracana]|uniref:Uncharacterized protein n=1 Tax=Eleusine coracana subsp. coracana TaxID=191504 RepID=A0AAV5CDI6_ELECO|nr:hypothetical protein PR202_ga13231 [Eleusine coracana subsp. coracana]
MLPRLARARRHAPPSRSRAATLSDGTSGFRLRRRLPAPPRLALTAPLDATPTPADGFSQLARLPPMAPPLCP